jgi:Excalibur calcium-binding domain
MASKLTTATKAAVREAKMLQNSERKPQDYIRLYRDLPLSEKYVWRRRFVGVSCILGLLGVSVLGSRPQEQSSRTVSDVASLPSPTISPESSSQNVAPRSSPIPKPESSSPKLLAKTDQIQPLEQSLESASSPPQTTETSPATTPNAEIVDPPSNCRIAPGTENAVNQILQRGDVTVDREAPRFDGKGDEWYQEKNMGCWLHHSQIRFPDQPMATEQAPISAEPPIEPVQPSSPATTSGRTTTEQTPISTEPPIEAVQSPTATTSSGYVEGTCKQLRRMGLSRFTLGDPNYTSKRDRDSDGIACE